jgi:hypothetical protein
MHVIDKARIRPGRGRALKFFVYLNERTGGQEKGLGAGIR